MPRCFTLGCLHNPLKFLPQDVQATAQKASVVADIHGQPFVFRVVPVDAVPHVFEPRREADFWAEFLDPGIVREATVAKFKLVWQPGLFEDALPCRIDNFLHLRLVSGVGMKEVAVTVTDHWLQ